MTDDATGACAVVAAVLGIVAGIVLTTLVALWVRSGLKDLERMFDL